MTKLIIINNNRQFFLEIFNVGNSKYIKNAIPISIKCLIKKQPLRFDIYKHI